MDHNKAIIYNNVCTVLTPPFVAPKDYQGNCWQTPHCWL